MISEKFSSFTNPEIFIVFHSIFNSGLKNEFTVQLLNLYSDFRIHLYCFSQTL